MGKGELVAALDKYTRWYASAKSILIVEKSDSISTRVAILYEEVNSDRVRMGLSPLDIPDEYKSGQYDE